jgi:hypothetical protein
MQCRRADGCCFICVCCAGPSGAYVESGASYNVCSSLCNALDEGRAVTFSKHLQEIDPQTGAALHALLIKEHAQLLQELQSATTLSTDTKESKASTARERDRRVQKFLDKTGAKPTAKPTLKVCARLPTRMFTHSTQPLVVCRGRR